MQHLLALLECPSHILLAKLLARLILKQAANPGWLSKTLWASKGWIYPVRFKFIFSVGHSSWSATQTCKFHHHRLSSVTFTYLFYQPLFQPSISFFTPCFFLSLTYRSQPAEQFSVKDINLKGC